MRNGLHPAFGRAGSGTPSGIDETPARRLLWLYAAIVLPLVAIGFRLGYLQIALPDEFATVFQQTETRLEDLPARDGRIVSADGTVLAYDSEHFDVELHYRWLEEPPNPNWLKQQALSRLTRRDRRQRKLRDEQEHAVLERRRATWDRLIALTGRDAAEFELRRSEIQSRVERIRDSVVERRALRDLAKASPAPPTNLSWPAHLWSLLVAELSAPPERQQELVIAEELQYHSILSGVTAEAAAEIEATPELYPGTKVSIQTERVYPLRDTAAHLVGTRTPVESDDVNRRSANLEGPDPLDYRIGDRRGKNGLEQSYDRRLRGLRGQKQIVYSRRGEELSNQIVRQPRAGDDLVLTIDIPLQQAAEQLLDAALSPATPVANTDEQLPDTNTPAKTPPTGGSIVALDIHSGAVLVAASAPRFDLNLLIDPDAERWREAVNDPRQVFFPRATQMALPPGSTFKIITAVAALEHGLSPTSELDCHGYLDRPTQHRCLTFRHFGHGHGPVSLGEALCQSCNVYFFTAARKMGPEALGDWARQFGIGHPTGIDLGHEASGNLPHPRDSASSGTKWLPAETLGVAIGQSSLKVTPLQMARAMAAVANGGSLITPRLKAQAQLTLLSPGAETPTVSVERTALPVHAGTLAAVRKGLEMVVADRRGTAYKTVRLPQVTIAGKTGTAEVGGNKPDHAWFVGYVPADRPRFAFCVVLEHGGSGGKVAGPVARSFVEAILERGLIHGRIVASTNSAN